MRARTNGGRWTPARSRSCPEPRQARPRHLLTSDLAEAALELENMSVLEDVHGVRLLGICAPPDAHLMDFVRIFVQKAQKRKMQNKNAAALAVVALSQSFPCDTNGPSK